MWQQCMDQSDLPAALRPGMLLAKKTPSAFQLAFFPLFSLIRTCVGEHRWLPSGFSAFSLHHTREVLLVPPAQRSLALAPHSVYRVQVTSAFLIKTQALGGATAWQ